MTAGAAARDGGAAPVVVLMAVTGRAPAAARAAAAWLADLAGEDRLIVTVPAGRERLRQSLDEAFAAPVGASSAVADDPRLRVLAVPGGRTAAALWRAGAAEVGGTAGSRAEPAAGSGSASDEVGGEAFGGGTPVGAGAVILADGTGRVTPGTVAGLHGALAAGARVAGVPALAADDSLAHAGHVPAGPGEAPWPLLAGQPAEDLAERAPALVVPMIATAPLILRPGDLALLDGVAAPGPGSGCAAITATLGGAVLVLGTGPAAEPLVVRRATGAAWDRSNPGDGRGAGDERGPGAGAGDPDRSSDPDGPGDPGPWPALPPWAGPPIDLPSAGLTVLPGSAGPRIERVEPAVGDVPDHPRRRRWAIVVASPAGPGGLAWGDTHFAADLAAALRRHGQQVAVVRRPAAESPARGLDDVAVVLRGLVRVRPVPGPTSVLWVISHPDLVEPDEPGRFDVVCAASAGWAARASSRFGVPVHPLLQATDPARFHPGLAEPDSGDRVLFVGNSRRQDRPMVRDALAAGADLAVYGAGWDALPPGVVRAPFLPPDRVGAAYRGAGVVLNDHWPDMAREGFVSNRLFDAVAAGARVVSDDAEGLRDVFGAAVRVVHGPDEVAAVLAMDPDDIVGDDTARRAAAVRIAAEHSFDARAATLIDLVDRAGR